MVTKAEYVKMVLFLLITYSIYSFYCTSKLVKTNNSAMNYTHIT